jgi:hypothetical protein
MLIQFLIVILILILLVIPKQIKIRITIMIKLENHCERLIVETLFGVAAAGKAAGATIF